MGVLPPPPPPQYQNAGYATVRVYFCVHDCVRACDFNRCKQKMKLNLMNLIKNRCLLANINTLIWQIYLILPKSVFEYIVFVLCMLQLIENLKSYAIPHFASFSHVFLYWPSRFTCFFLSLPSSLVFWNTSRLHYVCSDLSSSKEAHIMYNKSEGSKNIY